MPARQTVRRSVAMTPQLHARLRQLADHQPRPVSEAALIRRAIREYLDRQEDITGSRAHFRKTFRERVDALEAALTFRLDVLLALLAHGLAALLPLFTERPVTAAELLRAAVRDAEDVRRVLDR